MIPATAELTKVLRMGLSGNWKETSGAFNGDAASWRALSLAVLMREASRRGSGGTLTHLQQWLIFNPQNLREVNWDLRTRNYRVQGAVS